MKQVGGGEVPPAPSAPPSKYRSCVSCLQVQYGDWSICTNPPLVKIESGLISFVGASMFQQSQLNNFVMSFWKFSLNTHFALHFINDRSLHLFFFLFLNCPRNHCEMTSEKRTRKTPYWWPVWGVPGAPDSASDWWYLLQPIRIRRLAENG